MSSYTIELSWLLRGFSDFNGKPQLYASPHSVIDNSREEFFKAIGRYPFRIWNDERDQAFKEEFEKSFLEYFYMKEINYQTPTAFYLALGSFLRRKMPIYTTHWRMVLEEMYITQTGNVTGNVIGNAVNNDRRTIDSWGKSTTVADSTGESDTDSVARGGLSDTPQNNLDINLNNLNYASQVNKSDSKTHNETIGHNESVTDTEDHTVNVGHAVGDTTTDSITDNFGRNKDVFEIYDQWITSGYDLFTPLFQEMMKEQIFLPFN